MAPRRISSTRVAQRGVARREHADVVAGRRPRPLTMREARDGQAPPLGDHVVEQDRVEPAEHEVGIRMHVIVVGDGLEAVLARGREQDVVRDGAGERADAPAGEIGQRAKAPGVRGADAQHFAKRVVRDRGRHRGPPRRRVLDAAQADVGVAAGDGLIDGSEPDEDEPRRAPEAARDALGDLHVEAGKRRRDDRGRLRQTARRLRGRRPSAVHAEHRPRREMPRAAPAPRP